MGALVGWLGALFSVGAGIFAVEITKKTAVGLGAVSVYSGMVISLVVTVSTAMNWVNGLIGSISLPGGVVTGMAYFVPPHLVEMVAAVCAAKLAVALLHWNIKSLTLAALAS